MDNKNVILLAMSTLPRVNGDNKTSSINKSFFEYVEGNMPAREYKGQLEPATLAIKNICNVDKVFILATDETLEKNYIYDESGVENSCDVSAVDYYRIKTQLKESQIEIIKIDDINNLSIATKQAVECLRNYYRKHDNHVSLYVDTQGGFRNANLVVNAVLSLLRTDQNYSIKPEKIFSLKYSRDQQIQSLVDETKNYQIFQFVSGINEFKMSGKVDLLCDYYKLIDNKIPKHIKIIREIAEAIQMCNIKGFSNKLEELNKKYPNNDEQSNDFINIFDEEIRNDFGVLLNKNYTVFDVAEWLLRKGYYQQVLTYIESKIWDDLFDKKVMMIEGDVEKEIDRCKKANNKDYLSTKQYLLLKMMSDFVDQNCKHIKVLKKRCNLDDPGFKNPDLDWNSIIQNALNCKLNLCADSDGECSKLVNVDNKKCKVVFHPNCYECFDELFVLFVLLKNERNLFNHMGQEKRRANRGDLICIIERFIEVGKKLYHCMEGVSS